MFWVDEIVLAPPTTGFVATTDFEGFVTATTGVSGDLAGLVPGIEGFCGTILLEGLVAIVAESANVATSPGTNISVCGNGNTVIGAGVPGAVLGVPITVAVKLSDENRPGSLKIICALLMNTASAQRLVRVKPPAGTV